MYGGEMLGHVALRGQRMMLSEPNIYWICIQDETEAKDASAQRVHRMSLNIAVIMQNRFLVLI